MRHFRSWEELFSFGKGKPATKRYPGAPKLDKRSIGKLCGIAALIASGQQAADALGAFAKPGSAASKWFQHAIDPKFLDGASLASGSLFLGMKEEIKQKFRSAGGIDAAVTELTLDRWLDALGAFAREACYDRQRKPE